MKNRPKRIRRRMRERDRLRRNLEYLKEESIKDRIDRLYDHIYYLYREINKLKER